MLGVVVVAEVAREVGQLAQRAEELDRGGLRLQRFDLVHDLLVHVVAAQQLREGALGVGVREDQVGLDDLAVGQFDAGGLAVVGQDAGYLRAGPDRHADRLGRAGHGLGDGPHTAAHDAVVLSVLAVGAEAVERHDVGAAGGAEVAHVDRADAGHCPHLVRDEGAVDQVANRNREQRFQQLFFFLVPEALGELGQGGRRTEVVVAQNPHGAVPEVGPVQPGLGVLGRELANLLGGLLVVVPQPDGATVREMGAGGPGPAGRRESRACAVRVRRSPSAGGCGRT